MLNAAHLVNSAYSAGLAPPPQMNIAEWVEGRRYLSSPSPEPGYWRNARTPYLVGMMVAMSPFSAARFVSWMKGSQVGYTESCLNVIAYSIAHNPTSIMVVLPDEGTAKEWSNLRLARMVESTPALNGLISDNSKKTSGNSWTLKKFPRGFIKFAWASSAAKMRSTPAGLVILDEVDAFAGDTKGEGDPVTLMRRRFTNFPRGKMLMGSTPTLQKLSRIEREFQSGDQRYYFVPCPSCGRFQRLDFANLVYADRPAPVLRCRKCADLIEERHKTAMLRGGMWVATKSEPELKDVAFDAPDVQSIQERMEREEDVSFHLSAQYSPLGWYSWRTMVSDWKKAQGNPKQFKVFVNQVLGETWEDRGTTVDARVLFDRREKYPIGIVPEGGLFLTASADVQASWLVVEVVAWGRRGQRWSVYYENIQPLKLNDRGALVPCTMKDAEPWERLREILTKEWPIEGGGKMSIMCAGIDSGYADAHQEVYDFCATFPQPMHGPAGSVVTSYGTVVPLKGGPSNSMLLEGVSSIDAAKKRSGLRIVTIGAGMAKQSVYNALRLDPPVDGGEYPVGYYHYPDYKYDFFQGLTAETRVFTDAGKIIWRREGRNEPLDLAGYNLALRELCGASSWSDDNWKSLEELIIRSRLAAAAPPVQQMAAAPQRRIRGSFL